MKKLYALLILFIFIIQFILFPTDRTAFAASQPSIKMVYCLASGNSTYLVGENGSLWAWGSNTHYQLGDGTNIERDTPVEIKGLTGVKLVASNGYATMALKKDGTLWMWGNILENGDIKTYKKPKLISGLSNIKSIACGSSHYMVLKKDGSVWVWGENYDGQLGVNVGRSQYTPIKIPSLKSITAIDASNSDCIALKSDGTVWEWGYIDGYGGFGNLRIPQKISGLDKVTAVNFGENNDEAGHNIVALKADGSVWTWFSNFKYQNGVRIKSAKTWKPQKIDKALKVKAISRNLLVCDNGSLWTNSRQLKQQLNISPASEYIAVKLNLKAIDSNICISAISDRFIRISGSGDIWVWGNNSEGQMGIGLKDVSFISEPTVLSAFSINKLPEKNYKDINTFINDNEIIMKVSDISNLTGINDLKEEDFSWQIYNNNRPKKDLNAIAYGNGTFIATGNSGTVRVSHDTKSWSFKIYDKNFDFKYIVWDGKKFIALGKDNSKGYECLLTSNDGMKWTRLFELNFNKYGSSLDIKKMKWLGNKLILVGTITNMVDSYPIILSSSDGVKWKSYKLDRPSSFTSIAWNGEIYIATGNNTTSFIDSKRKILLVTSKDGVNWTDLTSKVTGLNDGNSGFNGVEDLIWDGNKFIAVGNFGGNSVYSSLDGLNWTNSQATSKAVTGKIYWNGKSYLISGGDRLNKSGGISCTSINGTEWMTSEITERNTDNTLIETKRTYINDVTWKDNKYTGVGTDGRILSSKDGVNWQHIITINHDLLNIAYNGKVFSAIEKTGGFFISMDGIRWTKKNIVYSFEIDKSPQFRGNASCSGKFAVISNKGILVTEDGNKWSENTPDGYEDLLGIISNNKVFVAYGRNGLIYTSIDGKTWTKQYSGISDVIQSIAINRGLFEAQCYGFSAEKSQKLLVSADGVKWTSRNLSDKLFSDLNAAFGKVRDMIWTGDKLIGVENDEVVTIGKLKSKK